MTNEELSGVIMRYMTEVSTPSDAPARLNQEEMLTLVLSPAGKPSQRATRIARRMLRSLSLHELRVALVTGRIDLSQFGLSSEEINRLKGAYQLLVMSHQPTHVEQASITSAADAAKLFLPEMLLLEHEELHLALLTTTNRTVEYIKLYKGTVNSSVLRIAEILRPAIVRNSPHVLLCHNHPSGDPTPSFEDLEVTKQLVAAAALMDIELIDHIILGRPPRFTSLREKFRW